MCLRPLTIFLKETKHWNSGNPRSILVPCGKCLECLKRYQDSWMIRLSEEFRNWSKACFVTLTYSNDNVPFFCDCSSGLCFLTVVKEHVQNALKRYRINYEREYGKKINFKYFITSEYGPRTLRPHYHCIFFGLDRLDLRLLLEDWRCRYGFWRCDNIKVNQESFAKVSRYVSKYCSKGFFENPYVKFGYVNKTFHLMSKRLGYSYVERMRDYHLCSSRFPVGSLRCSDVDHLRYSKDYLQAVADNMRVSLPNCPYSYSMPRYYKSLIYGKNPYLQIALSDFLFERACEVRDEKQRQVQATFGTRTDSETLYVMGMLEDCERVQRDRDLRTSLARFYDKSAL